MPSRTEVVPLYWMTLAHYGNYPLLYLLYYLWSLMNNLIGLFIPTIRLQDQYASGILLFTFHNCLCPSFRNLGLNEFKTLFSNLPLCNLKQIIISNPQFSYLLDCCILLFCCNWAYLYQPLFCFWFAMSQLPWAEKKLRLTKKNHSRKDSPVNNVYEVSLVRVIPGFLICSYT